MSLGTILIILLILILLGVRHRRHHSGNRSGAAIARPDLAIALTASRAPQPSCHGTLLPRATLSFSRMTRGELNGEQ